MTHRLPHERDRGLDAVELSAYADGGDDGASGWPDALRDGSGRALRAEAVLARGRPAERPQRPVELRVDGRSGKDRAQRVIEELDGAAGRVRLLEEDPELARNLPEPVRTALTEQLWVPVLEAQAGPWTPPSFDARTTFGLLLLDGLIGRRVQIARAVAVELVGPGHLIRPWVPSERASAVPAALRWQVFAPTRLAVLDERVTAAIARRPELMIAFSDRLLRRVRTMASLMAISHMTRVEDRLLGTLWEIADGCGRVTPDGVRIPIRLTHRVLAELVGAKRPSVTIALQQLRDRGELVRCGGGEYILAGSRSRGE